MRVSSLTLTSAEAFPQAAAEYNGFGYFGCWINPAKVTKIDLNGGGVKNKVATITLPACNSILSVAQSGPWTYWGTD